MTSAPSKVVNERPIRAHYSEGFRGYFDFHRDLVTWQYDEIARLTDESRTHKARADFNFEENERLNTEWCRVVQMMTDNDGEIDRLRSERDGHLMVCENLRADLRKIRELILDDRNADALNIIGQRFSAETAP